MPVYSTPPRAVQSAYVSYALYTLPPTVPPASSTAFLQLTWPTSYQDSPYVVAAYMEINGTYSAGFPIYLPDATQTSVGQNFIISNIGSITAIVYNFDQLVPVNIEPGIKYYFILVDNSTPAGIWHTLVFGASSGTVNPSDLVGYGLNSLALPPFSGSVLNTQVNVEPLSDLIDEYPVTIEDYTSLIVWTSGGGTITLPPVTPTYETGTVPPYFYVSINNAGTGEVVVSTIDNIQGNDSITLVPNETVTLVAVANAIVIGGGQASKWLTLGLTNLNLSSVTVNQLNVSGNDSINLTAQQLTNGIQVYSGTLTGNITIYFASTTAGEWWVNNIIDQASDPFELSVQAGTILFPVGTPYLVPRGSRLLFFSDGTNLGLQSVPFPIFPETTVNNMIIPSPTVNVTLNSNQAMSGIQQYNSDDGDLTANVTVFFPAVIPGEWEVYNNTTGAFTLSVQLLGSLGTAYVIPQGTIQSFYSDGTDMQLVSTIGTEMNGTPVASRGVLNFINGTNTTVNVVDTGTVIDVTVNSTNPGGTVTSVGVATTTLSLTGTVTNPIMTTGTFDINLPVVFAGGTFTHPMITVDTFGRITAVTEETNVVTANDATSIPAAPTAGIALLGSTGPGQAEVTTTAAHTDSVILITPRDAPVTGRQVTVPTIVDGVSFTIQSSDAGDLSDVSWMIINPV